MGEEQAEIAVHLFEGRQQAFAPLAVQARDPGAQLLDRLFQIGLFGDQRVMFGLDLLRVFLGTQVDRAQRVALAAQAVDVVVQRLGRGHRFGVGVKTLQQRRRVKLRLLMDALDGMGHAFAGGLGARLGPRAGLARLGRGAFGGAFVIGRLAQRRFGPGQPVGGGAAAGLGGVDGLAQFGALGGDLGGRGRGFLQLRLGRLFPFGKLRAALFGGLKPVAPAGDLLGDLLPPLHPRLALAADLVMGRAFGEHRHPRRLDRQLDVLHLGPCGRKIWQRRDGGFGLFQPAARAHCLFLVPGDGKAGAFQLAARDGTVGLGLRQRARRIDHPPVGLTPRIARGTVGLGRLGQAAGQVFMRPARALGPAIGLFQIALQVSQPVQLLKPQRGGGRRILGPGAEPVPAPKIALNRDEPLTGFQKRLQAGALAPFHQTDLPDPARKDGGDIDDGGQRADTSRQGLRVRISRQLGPAGRAVSTNLRRTQIVGQRRPQRLFIALLHLDPVEQLLACRGLPLHQLQKCCRLGLERAPLAFRRGKRRAGLGLTRLGIGARLIGGGKGGLGGLGGACGLGLRGLGGLVVSGGAGQRGLGLGRRRCRLRRLGFGFLQRGAAVGQQAVRRLVSGGQPRDILGQFGQRVFPLRQHPCRVLRYLKRLGQTAFMAFGGLGDLVLFPFQPTDGFARVAVQPGLTLHVMRKLTDPALQRLDRLDRAVLLILQRIALHLKPLQDGGRDGLFLAQGRQVGFAFTARAGGLSRGGLGLGCQLRAFGQVALGRRAGLIGLAPATVQQHPFGPAQFLADFTVARRLPRLPGKLGKLLGKLLDHVLDAGEVLFGAVQLQLRLMPALVETGNPRRLFQDTAAVLRLGVDQLRDLPLPHQRGRMGAGRGIGEQHLDVARPHVLGVGLVGRPCVAGDAADDLQRVLIVEARRREAFGIVDGQRHLGKVPRRAAGGAGEDHVLHPAAAHGRGAVFAHHPAQRLKQVRLAATVRAHNAGQPLMDDQIRGVDEAFEAVQTQAGETQDRDAP